MDSAFAAAWLQASPDIDRVFGSSFLYEARCQDPAGGSRTIVDPSRPAKIILGALTEKPTFVYPETRSRRGSMVAQEATQEMMIDIASLNLPYDPQSGDRLTAVTLDLTGKNVVARGASYEVNGPQPDGIARNELRVFKRSSGSPVAGTTP